MVDGQSLRWWTSVEPALGGRDVFAAHSVVVYLATATGPLSYAANTGYSRDVCPPSSMLAQYWVKDPCLLGIGYQPLSCGRGDISSFVYKNGKPSSSYYVRVIGDSGLILLVITMVRGVVAFMFY